MYDRENKDVVGWQLKSIIRCLHYVWKRSVQRLCRAKATNPTAATRNQNRINTKNEPWDPGQCHPLMAETEAQAQPHSEG